MRALAKASLIRPLFGPERSEFTLKLFHLLTIALATRWIGWELNWDTYTRLAPSLYSPVGLAFWIGLPSTSALELTRLATIVLGCANALLILVPITPSKPKIRVTEILLGLGFASGLFLLDSWHNQFGFVDERIHFVWFALIAALRPAGRRFTPFLILALEIIVCVVYLQSGFAKLWISGIDWAFSGTTLQIAWLRQGLPLGATLSAHSQLAIALSSLALLFELSFAFYFALGKSRVFLLLSSLAFHFFTWITMGIAFEHLWVFAASILIVTCMPRPIERAIRTARGTPFAALAAHEQITQG